MALPDEPGTPAPDGDPPEPKNDPPSDPPKGDSGGGDPPLGPDGEPFDAERAMRTIGTLREAEKAGKQAAKERDDLQARLTKLEDAAKTEDEKKAERLAALEAEKATWDVDRRELLLERSVLTQANELGVADAELALAAIDRSEIEFDDDGRPSNTEEVLKALLERKPLLKGEAPKPQPSGDLDGGPGRTNGPAPNLTDAEAASAAETGMDPKRYEDMKGVSTLDQYMAVTGKPADGENDK